MFLKPLPSILVQQMSELVDLDMTPRGSGKINFSFEQRMTLELSNDEIQYLMSLLGEQPTKTGAWLVLQNITQQVQKQGEENV